MLTSVEIKNYRGFQHYRMEGLSRVNLLVGKNNSGKTTLLEGIQFLTAAGDPAVLQEITQRRGEVLIETTPAIRQYADIRHLFYEHEFAIGSSFSIAGNDGYAPLHAEIELHRSPRPGEPDATSVVLKIVGKAKSIVRVLLSQEGGAIFAPTYSTQIGTKSNKMQTRFVGAESATRRYLAQLWDDITRERKESYVEEAMRILDPNIESVRILTGASWSGTTYSKGGILVGMKGQKTLVPLGSMGDGVWRMMVLAASLAFTQGSCLFIDEIDTGLHYSVLADMWKLVITQAVASNIQVFVTTHSWDCIEGLSLFCQRQPEMMNEVAIHKIDRSIPHSIPFAGESIVRMVKAEIDPR